MDDAPNRSSGNPSESRRPVASTNGWRATPDIGKKPTIYWECLKNHAANIGGHALDGCGEFMGESADPLKCAACGCHRNFHRSDANPPRPFPLRNYCSTLPPPSLVQPHPTTSSGERRSSESPPPNTPSPYNSAPQMLLALSGGGPSAQVEAPPVTDAAWVLPSTRRRRMRTRFNKEQKDRMLGFAERFGWKLQRQDEGLIQQFCDETGIKRSALKVWLHNHKSNLAPKDHSYNNTNS